MKGKYITFYMGWWRGRGSQDLQCFFSNIKKNGLCMLLNIYVCAKELGCSTEHWARAQRAGFGVHAACARHPFSLRLYFPYLKIRPANATWEIKGEKSPERGRGLMVSFLRCFICFISVHLRKGINPTGLMPCAGSQNFLCPWSTEVGRSVHVL